MASGGGGHDNGSRCGAVGNLKVLLNTILCSSSIIAGQHTLREILMPIIRFFNDFVQVFSFNLYMI
jgi:hypothetical protein